MCMTWNCQKYVSLHIFLRRKMLTKVRRIQMHPLLLRFSLLARYHTAAAYVRMMT